MSLWPEPNLPLAKLLFGQYDLYYSQDVSSSPSAPVTAPPVASAAIANQAWLPVHLGRNPRVTIAVSSGIDYRSDYQKQMDTILNACKFGNDEVAIYAATNQPRNIEQMPIPLASISTSFTILFLDLEESFSLQHIGANQILVAAHISQIHGNLENKKRLHALLIQALPNVFK